MSDMWIDMRDSCVWYTWIIISIPKKYLWYTLLLASSQFFDRYCTLECSYLLLDSYHAIHDTFIYLTSYSKVAIRGLCISYDIDDLLTPYIWNFMPIFRRISVFHRYTLLLNIISSWEYTTDPKQIFLNHISDCLIKTRIPLIMCVLWGYPDKGGG